MTKVAASVDQEIAESLRKRLPAGKAVYCVLRHVSQSGMMREISFFALAADGPDGEPTILDITVSVGELLGWKIGKHDGLRISGCGMDMGFYAVSRLSRKLYGDDYKLEKRWL